MGKKIITVSLILAIALSAIGSFSAAAGQSNDNARESTFDYPLYGDPYYMSDEGFFGKWDSGIDDWSLPGLFNYDKYPAMSEVENAVKLAEDGDYTEAKQELLTYYRGLQSERVAPVFGTSGVDRVHAELLGDNVFDAVVSSFDHVIFNVNENWQNISVNVLSRIKTVINNREEFASFLIQSVSQTSTAEFMTKEGGNAPFLRVNVNNGTIMEFPAISDTYISAGTNAGRNFGKEPTMLASSGVGTNYDSDTKRPYMLFKISGIKPTDNISAASIIIKGRNKTAAEAIEAGISYEASTTKKMILNTYANSSWNENTATWNNTVQMGKFSLNGQDHWDFSRVNWDRTLTGDLTQHFRGMSLQNPAKMWAGGQKKDEQYAYTFLRHIMSLVNFVGPNRGGPPTAMDDLEIALHMNQISKGVMYTIDSTYMSPEVFTALVKHLYLTTKLTIEKIYGVRTNNWATFATSGVYTFISIFREMNVYDDWLLITKNENSRVNGRFVLSDGTSIEASTNYVSTLLGTLIAPINTSTETNNPDLPFHDEDFEQIENMVTSFGYFMAPGFRTFFVGDETNYLSNGFSARISEFYNTIFSDKSELEFFATGGEFGTAPSFTSISMPEGLRTIMRSGWDSKAIALNINARPKLSHTHRDQLSIAMWAYGKFLLTDQGYGNSMAPLDILRSSQNHNMVVMNDKTLPITPAAELTGEWLGGELNNHFDFTSYAIAFTPDARTQQRSVLFDRIRKVFVVSDYIHPKEMGDKNSYAQYWHMLPDANMTIEDAGIIRSHFEDVNVSVTPVAPEKFSSVEFAEGLFAPNTGSWYPTKKAVYNKRNIVGDVTYDTVIVPEDIGESFTVDTFSVDTGLPQGAANAFFFDLIDNKKGTTSRSYYLHLNDTAKKGGISVGKYETDATTMYVTEDVTGKLDSVFLMNATYLKDSDLIDKYVFKSTEEIPAISFKVVGQSFEINSSVWDNELLNEMTLYDYKKLNGVLIKGKFTTAKKSGNYMYFGDAPIVTGTEEAEDNENSPEGSKDNGPAHAGGGNTNPKPNNVGIPPIAIPTGNTPQPPKTPGERELPEQFVEELKNHWAEEEIAELYRRGIVNGDQSSLCLSDTVTRAELVAMVVRALELDSDDSETEFLDVSSDDWYADVIAAASKNGLIEGTDGKFRPNDNITREEMCKIIYLAYELKNGTSESDDSEMIFADDSEISDWVKSYAYGAQALGLIKGMEDGTFRPKEDTLREQAFMILWRLLSL